MIALLAALVQAAAPVVIDDFDGPLAWTAHPADGVTETVRSDAGRRGRALRMDFRFSGGGYAIVRRAVDLRMPSNYALSFWIKGSLKQNTLEFKLVDESGENVWWYTEPDRVFSGDWERITIRKRQIRFAWGPLGDSPLTHAAAIEVVVTAGRGGGAGTIWLDDLELAPLPDPVVITAPPRATGPDGPASAAVDGDTTTAWRLETRQAAALTVDFQGAKELGALTVHWEPGRAARDYDVAVSDDGAAWRTAAEIRGGNGGRDDVFLPETEARYVRLVLRAPEGRSGYGIREVIAQPLAVGAHRNAFFEHVARGAPRGIYPRYYAGERAAWTVLGVDHDREDGLISEDGAIDPAPGAFSVEPFVRHDGLLTWADGATTVSLRDGDLPIPSVTRTTDALALTVTAFAAGSPGAASIVARYRVTNRTGRPIAPELVLAVRPFQVNAQWQFLGVPGGAARIDSIRWAGGRLRINGDRAVIPRTAPGVITMSTWAGGEIGERLRAADLRPANHVADPFGAASAALVYPLRLAPGGSAEVAVEIPLGTHEPGRPALLRSRTVARLEDAAAADWRDKTSRATIELPESGRDLANTIRTNQAWVMINRAGPAIQPGTRSYARSWIRDGALTSAAMLRFGHAELAREFLAWYAPFQYENGKVPCCVDWRGADPVPEHDSSGQLIYLAMEYWRHTGDRTTLASLWPRVVKAVGYLDSLRQTRRTAEYRADSLNHFFGLLPPSISHEGYSAKPMHSYWDDFFALRGFTDAVLMAELLGHAEEAKRIGAIRDEFAAELRASLVRSMAVHGIDYLPGAADLGDFDATSTTIAVTPVEATALLPDAALRATFERYWRSVARRPDSTGWEAYTPYEIRTVGTTLRLGWKDRALHLLRMFLDERDPPGWNQWSEVYWREPRAPKFIGDTPHTWVGSDFLRAAADLFAYEVEGDECLVIGAGIDPAWLADAGVRVRRLSTWWGPLSYQARRAGGVARYAIEAGVRVPAGGLRVVAPEAGVRGVSLNGAALPAADTVVVRTLPAVVEFRY